MPFPLTINRVMGLCAFETTAKQRKSYLAPESSVVANAFREQLREISGEILDPIYCAMYDKAKAIGIKFKTNSAVDDRDLAVIQKPEKTDKRAEVRFFPRESYAKNTSAPRNEPIVGLFQSRTIRATIGDTPWDVRIRPSVTACALEGIDRRSKLWWTFEGVPIDRRNAPTEADSIEFVRKSTTLAELGLEELQKAYVATLPSISGEERGRQRLADRQLRVTLADNTDDAFYRLVDVLSLTSTSFAEVWEGQSKPAVPRGEDVRAGATQVMRYIRKTAGETKPQSVRLMRGSGGRAAIHCEAQPDLGAPKGISRWVISGLTSSIGMISTNPADPSWVRFAEMPDLARSVSAARPLSAKIADGSARQLEIVRAPEPA